MFTVFRQLEHAIWRLVAEAEYRLTSVPRGTRLQPRKLDQRLLRTVLIMLPVLLGTFFVRPPTRTRLLLLLCAVVVVVVVLIFWRDAYDEVSAPPKGPPRAPRPGPSTLPPRPGARSVTTSSMAPVSRPPARPSPPPVRKPRSP